MIRFMTPQSDAELVKLTLTQGSHYFGQLVKRHSDYLFGLGMRLSAGDAHLSHDLAQSTFLNAFKYLASFDPNRKNINDAQEVRFKNWLTRIAINNFNDMCRENSKYQHLENEETVADESQNKEVSDDFFQLIRPLTIEQRTLITLKYIYEYSNQEIASLMSLKLGTVKSRLNRSLNRLKQAENAL